VVTVGPLVLDDGGCFGCYGWPLAIAELGLRYLRSNFSETLGQSMRNLLWTAFRSVKILGLHRDWWADLKALAL
jgi:hypothetical protein